MSFDVRCHKCSHSVGVAAIAVELVALFKASRVGNLRPSHLNEVRRRCKACGWVNVFHPLRTGRPAGVIEAKA